MGVLDRLGAEDGGFEMVVVAVKRERLTAPQTSDDSQTFAQHLAAHALVGLVAQVAELLLATADAHAHDKAAAAELIQ